MKKLCIIGAFIFMAAVNNEIFTYIALTALCLIGLIALLNERARCSE